MKKGFVFVETMVVIAFLGTVLLTVYSAFSSVIDNAKTRLYYDDPVYLYRTYYILSLLEENNLNDFIDLKFADNNVVINEISCENSTVMIGENSNNNIRDFCSTKLIKDWNVNHIFIMRYNVTGVVSCSNNGNIDCVRNNNLKSVSLQMINYLYSLDGYTGVYDENSDNDHYRIVVEYRKDIDEEFHYHDYLCKGPDCKEEKDPITLVTSKYYYSTMEVPYGSSLADGATFCDNSNKPIIGTYTNVLKNYYKKIGISNIEKIKFEIINGAGLPAARSGETHMEDISHLKNDKVRGYYNASTKTLIIRGLGGLYANCNASHMFADLGYLKEFESFNNLSTIYTSDMSWMFYNCLNITKIDFKNFATARATTMRGMFANCLKLGSESDGLLDLTSFNTRKVTDMSAMFRGLGSFLDEEHNHIPDYVTSFEMKGIKRIIFGNNFITSNVTKMDYMFYNNVNLRGLNVESFDTSKVVNMEWMFGQCRNLGNKKDEDGTTLSWMKDWVLDLSRWDTSKVKSFKRMFILNRTLPSIKFGKKFNINSAESIEGMFGSCPALKDLDLSSFKNNNAVRIGGNPNRKNNVPLKPNEYKWWANGLFFATVNLKNIDMRNFDFCNLDLISPQILSNNPPEYFMDKEYYGKPEHFAKFELLYKTKGLVFMRSGVNNSKVTVIVGDDYFEDDDKKNCIRNIVENNEFPYAEGAVVDDTQVSRIKFVTADGRVVIDEP